MIAAHPHPKITNPRHAAAREYVVYKIEFQACLEHLFVAQIISHDPEEPLVQPRLRVVVQKLHRNNEQQRPGMYLEQVLESKGQLVADGKYQYDKRRKRDDIDDKFPASAQE